jgi:hypothetical protein
MVSAPHYCRVLSLVELCIDGIDAVGELPFRHYRPLIGATLFRSDAWIGIIFL